YEKMKKAIGLLKLLAQGEQDITTGKVLSQEDFFAEMDNSFDHSRV
ncbi:MAG TPA: type II toxin-antitoxin system Phd/YefM family antitoxin, partial [Firmicutes bacterium]|nr:type II toxin-antitoxin system Phd/YefM family antitoxin [Bacillota bacterium]